MPILYLAEGFGPGQNNSESASGRIDRIQSKQVRIHIRLKRVYQRIYISDRTHSIPLRLPNMCLTQPLPALSVVYIEYTTPTT